MRWENVRVSLVAEVSCVNVAIREIAVNRRRREELHVRAKVVAACTAHVAAAAGHSRLNRYAVPRLQGENARAHRQYPARGLVP